MSDLSEAVSNFRLWMHRHKVELSREHGALFEDFFYNQFDEQLSRTGYLEVLDDLVSHLNGVYSSTLEARKLVDCIPEDYLAGAIPQVLDALTQEMRKEYAQQCIIQGSEGMEPEDIFKEVTRPLGTLLSIVGSNRKVGGKLGIISRDVPGFLDSLHDYLNSYKHE